MTPLPRFICMKRFLQLWKTSSSIGPIGLRWVLNLCASILMGLVLASAVVWLNFDSMTAVRAWVVKYPFYLPLTASFYLAAI